MLAVLKRAHVPGQRQAADFGVALEIIVVLRLLLLLLLLSLVLSFACLQIIRLKSVSRAHHVEVDNLSPKVFFK